MAGPILDAKTLAMMQASIGVRAANRSGKSGPRLLDDGENNVGNATTLLPQVLPAGQAFTTIKPATTPRLLNLTGQSKAGQSVTVTMTASRIANQNGVAGPVTGIIEFGNGAVSTKLEFDIPIGPFVAAPGSSGIAGVSPGTTPEDGGAVIQIPTGIVRAFARYDNAYITPNLLGNAFGTPGAFGPLPPGSGPFSPANAVPPLPTNPGSTPLSIKAFANYFGRVHSKMYKTLYVYNGNTSQPVPFGPPIQGIDIRTCYAIPPFAKSVQVIRTPFTSSMIMILSDLVSISGAGLGGFINIPANQPGPTIPIVGNQCVVGISSASNNDPVSAVSLVFEIGF